MELTLWDGRILRGQITKYLNSVKKADKFIGRLNKKYNKLAFNRLRQMARNAIDEFYNDDFKPKRYRRRYGLRKSFKIITTPNGEWNFLIGPEYMGSHHHQSNEIIYNNSLITGVHGGSFREDVGDYFWRKPHPDYTEWWPTPAPRGPENIEQEVLDQAALIIFDLEKQKQKEFDDYISIIENDLQSSLSNFL